MATNQIISMKVEKLDELKRFVDNFGTTAAKGPAKKGVKAVASYMRGQARIFVPKRSGRGARSLGYTVRKIKGDPLGYEGVTGIQKGARSMERFQKRLAKRKKIKGEARGAKGKQKRLRATMTPTYLRYLEGGWNQRIGKGRKGTRFIAAKPWLAPTFKANTSKMLSIFVEEFKKAEPEAIEKAKRGQK